MAVIAEPLAEREFYQACAESVRRSQDEGRRLRGHIDTLLADLAALSAQPVGTGAPGGRAGQAQDPLEQEGSQAQALLEQEMAAVKDIAVKLIGLLDKQLTALDMFNIVLFGRTGTGKS